jgi:hypothetical protein
MTRKARIDLPGILHPPITLETERQDIFRDKADKEDFVGQLSKLAPETRTSCYALADGPKKGKE